MNIHRSTLATIITAFATLGLLGCGGSGGGGEDRPDTYAISGTVTFNGAPIEGASVTFVPVETEGKSAAGFTDAAGHYTLTTFTAGDGAVAGQYRVKISKFGQPAAPAATATTADSGFESAIPEDAGYNPDADSGDTPASNLLPAKYADANSSGFMVEVVAGENPPQDFALQ